MQQVGFGDLKSSTAIWKTNRIFSKIKVEAD
jgi:hypothetical protein